MANPNADISNGHIGSVVVNQAICGYARFNRTTFRGFFCELCESAHQFAR
jgi:hypothetical protein